MKTSHLPILCLIATAVLPFATSCRKEADSGIAPPYACFSDICLVRAGGPSCFSSSIDVFAYEDDTIGNLDSYQHLDGAGERIEIASRSGKKRFVVVANAKDKLFTYNDIINYDGLASVYSRLADENPENPVMSGESRGFAGRNDTDMTIKPLMARVRVNSFFVDFIGKPYSNLEFDSPKAYLINVNGMCPVLGTASSPVEVLNHGRLDETSLNGLSRPEMLVCEGVTGHPLYCYPCDGTAGSLGFCTTRLVIEGKIGGVTYYYPINVGDGIVERGLSYAYDITITRPGMQDPDTPVDLTMAKVEMHIENWKEYENETIYF